ncbi:hypothetical protein F0562_006932 [Nyssa sinensis]|uniref:Uncharacterized protein n=1 Tax=Nyssa sinensis TaxID=561372 RepID=A0A5J5A4Y0_9ASTE|nr:hypothetical protein F0562_006932 [Nyssa sinensis]
MLDGREREAAVCLMQKYTDKGSKLQIRSAVALDHLKNYIYIEVDKEAHVREACQGMRNLFSNKVMLVPIKEMTDVLSVESKTVYLSKDTWVRMKTGTYKGDLAKDGREVPQKKAFVPPPRFMNVDEASSENSQLLCVAMQTNELWNSSFKDSNHLKKLEAKWNPLLSKIKNVIIKKASAEDLETAASLLRCSYNFHQDTSCLMLPSGVNLYMVPSQFATEAHFQPGMDGLNILELSIPRKLLLWAYTLLHGCCTNMSFVIKYCEENAKKCEFSYHQRQGAIKTQKYAFPCSSAKITLARVLF